VQRERIGVTTREVRVDVAEIAAATGFVHQNHMARHMRRVLGMPPLKVKRLLEETATN
jgi:AraC family transcriptional regulator